MFPLVVIIRYTNEFDFYLCSSLNMRYGSSTHWTKCLMIFLLLPVMDMHKDYVGTFNLVWWNKMTAKLKFGFYQNVSTQTCVELSVVCWPNHWKRAHTTHHKKASADCLCNWSGHFSIFYFLNHNRVAFPFRRHQLIVGHFSCNLIHLHSFLQPFWYKSGNCGYGHPVSIAITGNFQWCKLKTYSLRLAFFHVACRIFYCQFCYNRMLPIFGSKRTPAAAKQWHSQSQLCKKLIPRKITHRLCVLSTQMNVQHKFSSTSPSWPSSQMCASGSRFKWPRVIEFFEKITELMKH